MAARKKASTKKKRARRGRRAASTAETKRLRAAAKKRSAAKKRTTRTSKKRVAAKKRATSTKKRAARVPAKKRAASKNKRAAAKKKRKVISPAQRAAITRTLRAFAALPTQREYTRLALKDIYRVKRSALIEALARAGLSPASIRARLGWITRRRNKLREDIATRRVTILGTTLLHGSDPDQRRILATMIRERDERFLRFAQDMRQMTLEWSEIVNEWFSPKVQSA